MDVGGQLVVDGERHDGPPVRGAAVRGGDAGVVERILDACREAQEGLHNHLQHVQPVWILHAWVFYTAVSMHSTGNGWHMTSSLLPAPPAECTHAHRHVALLPGQGIV